MRSIGLLFAAASLLFAGAVIVPGLLAPTLEVPAQYESIQRAIDAAPAGATIRIGPGSYREALVISRPVTLIGAPGGLANVDPGGAASAITIRSTHGVRVEGLTVTGGDQGFLVEESQAVQLIGNHVIGARFAGIRLSRAAALIKNNEIRAGSGPYGMGIELANTMSRPPTVITGNLVAGATREGIILHNSHAMIDTNTVSGNGLRGISINEMSMATVSKNTIMDNADAGIWVVDSSRADIDGNHIGNVRPGPEGRLNGIAAFYYGEVMLGRTNQIDLDPAQAISASLGATVESR